MEKNTIHLRVPPFMETHMSQSLSKKMDKMLRFHPPFIDFGVSIAKNDAPHETS